MQKSTSKGIHLKYIFLDLSQGVCLFHPTHMSREPPAGSLPRKQADITNTHTHTHKHARLLDRLFELANRGASGRLIPPPQESESVLHVFGPAQKCTEGKELSSEGDKQTNKPIKVMENTTP